MGFFIIFFPLSEQFSDYRKQSQYCLLFDFTEFSVEMLSAYSSQLYLPLNSSGSGIKVTLEREIFLNVQKLQYTGQAETELSVDSQSQRILPLCTLQMAINYLLLTRVFQQSGFKFIKMTV